MGRVLVVDDEQGLRDALEVLISSKGHTVRTASGVAGGIETIRREHFDLVITDLRLEPGGDGMDVLRAARSVPDPPEVIVMTAFGTRDKAREAVKDGASFYLEKGPHLAPDIEVLMGQAIKKRQLTAENESLKRALVDRYSLEGIVGRSEAMREVFQLIQRLASVQASVLIFGESGTGKERVSEALHYGGARRDGPFVPINCGAIPENLIESELFGHVKGAFTGADSDKEGVFASAAGGTLFLDEIGELPMALQPKLLRVLQERRIKPVGAAEELPVDARVIAATNRDLEAEVRAGRFREDLYFRLNVLQIDLPPLRHRKEDVPLLIEAFLRQFSKTYDRRVTSVSTEAMDLLLAYRFPGNVRQLMNILERGVALATGEVLTVDQLPKEVRAPGKEPQPRVVLEPDAKRFPEEGVELDRLVEAFEFDLIQQALDHAGGVKTKAAELLGLSFRQFRYKLSKYQRRNGSDGHKSS